VLRVAATCAPFRECKHNEQRACASANVRKTMDYVSESSKQLGWDRPHWRKSLRTKDGIGKFCVLSQERFAELFLNFRLQKLPMRK
jgi:hypothetical protein